jgi:hypothetical protein
MLRAQDWTLDLAANNEFLPFRCALAAHTPFALVPHTQDLAAAPTFVETLYNSTSGRQDTQQDKVDPK